MADYTLFLDETTKTPNNPYFCLAGIILTRLDYENALIPAVNDLKTTYFSTTNIIFHYTEMKKNVNGFEILKDDKIRTKFWQDFNKMLEKINFITIGVYFNEKEFKDSYNIKHNKHYNYAFINLMNNYMTFLKRNNSIGAVVFESRQWKENAEIQSTFIHLLECGTDLYSPEECRQLLSTLSFFTKKDNCAGLQIADFVPDSYVRELNHSRNFYNVKENIIKKTMGYGSDKQGILGLKRL